jgi:Lon-like ATP-dependent protease
MEERHRQMLLRDELKAIRAELGLEKPQTETLLAKFKERIAAKKIPEQARKVIDEEMDRFTHLQPSTSEYNVVRTHLDWLTLLPWGTYSKENLNMLHAEKILEEDHYGLQDVKDRILEFIAVGNLKGEVTGKIICLVGPPGVGKTSIGKSIAHALGREFYRFSVGGMTDEAEIKGHRRTYIGAMPGKLLQALKVVNTSNPVILIDEIDKLGTGGYKGDPSSALLEVLDPEQNVSFLDHYLDVNYDLSKVLFVCTANVTHTIPRPLLDRMEVIRLSGYVEEEKAQIASRYLIPRALTETGLSEKQVHTTDGAVRKLINSYCREAGVRNLQHQIEKIYRKVAYKLVNAKEGGLEVDQTTNQLRSKLPPHPIDAEAATHSEKDQQSLIDQPKIDITENNLEEYLGKAPYTSDRYYAQTPPGVVMGLAWTSMGGSTPYIETVLDRFQYLKLIAQREKQASKATTTTDIHFKNKKKKQQQSVKSQPADRPAGGGGGAGGGSGRLVTTGQLGDVMKESSNIAYTYAKLFWAKLHQQKKQRPLAKLSLQDSQPHQMHTALHQLDQSNAENTNMKPMGASPPQLNPKQEETWNQQFFNDALLHMHLPEGATPKDGPSAGISMVTSLLSLAMNKPVRQNLAMTGEITLTGKVLPVGGIKEKVIAARRANVTTLIFPIENKKDWLELPDYIKQGLHVHFADYYQDVFDVAFAEAESTQHSADTQQQPQSVTAAHTTNSHQPAAYHHYSTQSHSFF